MCIRDRYIEAGSDIILTNTFGANALKFHDDSCSLEEIIKAAGGFAGEINGAVIGEMNESESGVHVSNVRSVTGGEYAEDLSALQMYLQYCKLAMGIQVRCV